MVSRVRGVRGGLSCGVFFLLCHSCPGAAARVERGPRHKHQRSAILSGPFHSAILPITDFHLRTGFSSRRDKKMSLHLSGGAGELQLHAGRGIAEVVRADALLGRVLLAHLLVPVGRATHAQGGGCAGQVVTVPGEFRVLGGRGEGNTPGASESKPI